MKRTPIKVKLLRYKSAVGTDGDLYQVTQITGAVTIGCGSGRILRAGDRINEKDAEHLTHSYIVSVGASA